MKRIWLIIGFLIILNYNNQEVKATIIIPSSVAEEIERMGFEANEEGIFKASIEGNIKVLNYFIQSNANVNIRDKEGRTPVYYAAEAGNVKVVKYLLLCGADINARTDDLKSPLMAAIEAKSYETAKILIDHNASLINTDIEGKTALHYAVINNELRTLRYMLSRYCDIDGRDDYGNTPLFYAGDKSIEYIEAIINAGADKDGKNSDGRTVLHEAVIKNNFENVKFLIENGVNVNIEDESGHTPIFYTKRDNPIYIYLIESGAKMQDE